jgi:hypothetical protein
MRKPKVQKKKYRICTHLLSIGTHGQLVKDVERTFTLGLEDDAIALQQVRLDRGTDDHTASIKLETDELAETRRVVVLQRFGVTERLEDRVGLQDLLLQSAHEVLANVAGNGGKILNNLLRVLGLARTRFTAKQKGK